MSICFIPDDILQKVKRQMEGNPVNEDITTLYDFADLHGISRNEALSRWRLGMIAGSNRGTTCKPNIVIAANGRRDIWVQFHDTPGFISCDSCPHQ